MVIISTFRMLKFEGKGNLRFENGSRDFALHLQESAFSHSPFAFSLRERSLRNFELLDSTVCKAVRILVFRLRELACRLPRVGG